MNKYKMSYSNGLLSDQTSQPTGQRGKDGLPGVGFKLTSSGDYNMENKKLTNVRNPTNLKDATNWGTAKTHFLNVDGCTHDW